MYKKTFLILILFFLLTIKVKSEPLILEGFPKDNILNIKENPDTASNVIFSIQKNEKFKIIDADEKDEWYKVEIKNKYGWVSKNAVTFSIPSSLEYKVTSNIGTNKETGLIKNAIKIASNGLYKIILDNRGNKLTLLIYNKNDDYVKNIPFFYYWANNTKDFKDIVLCIDNDNNIYTNSSAKNIIFKYDMNGVKLGEIKLDSSSNLTSIRYYNENLFILDSNSKIIKLFNNKLELVRDIFLTESINPQSFDIKNNNIYLLDYPEKDEKAYQVYYVNSYSFNFKNSPDLNGKNVESLPKGSIINKNDLKSQIKSKSFENNDPTKIKEIIWLDFSEKNKKIYANLNDLNKVNVIGKINIYKISGEFIDKISLNEKIILKNNDKHKTFFTDDITRKILSISVDSSGNIIMPVLSKTKNSSNGIINYYYFNKNDKSYKISNQVSYNELFDYTLENNDIYFTNSNGFLDIFDSNGIEKSTLGRKENLTFNLPENIFFYDNYLSILDKGNFSIGNYDLNGDLIIKKSFIQKMDNFNLIKAFYINNNIYLLKTIENEEKKLGLEIYNKDLTKTFDKWLMSLDFKTIPNIGVNPLGEIFVYGNSSFFATKQVLAIFNEYGHFLFRFKNDVDLAKMYSEENQLKIKGKELKFLNFDNKGNLFFLVPFKEGNYKIQKIKLKNDGTSEILRNYSVTFFEEILTYEENKVKKEKREFTGSINGEILQIIEGKNNYTYFLFKNRFTKECSIGIYSPVGIFVKEIKLDNSQETKGFTLDNKDNIYITDISLIKKLSNDN